MIIGFLIVIMTVVSYILYINGYSSMYTKWFIQNATPSLKWVEYLKSDDNDNLVEEYTSFIYGIEDMVEDFCTSSFPCISSIKSITDNYKRNIMGISIDSEAGGKTYMQYAIEAADYVDDFAQYLEKKDISFLYVQLPSQQVTNDNYKNYFSQMMKQKNINFINIYDYSEAMSPIEFDASGHWLPRNALETTAIIVNKLNGIYGYKFDADKYDIDNYYNILSDSPDIESEIENDYGYTYSFLVPKNSLTYQVNISGNYILEGGFEETLLKDVSEWNARILDNGGAIAYHNMCIINNGSKIDIINKGITNNPNKKILLLGDSFTWPISMYLSQDLGELCAINPFYYYGDVNEVIVEYNPDLIMWIYQDGVIGEEDNGFFNWIEVDS
jgi:hypothetical protein